MKQKPRLDAGILERYFLSGVLDRIQLKNFCSLPLIVTPSETENVWHKWETYVAQFGGKVYKPEHLLFRECVVWCNKHYCRYHQLDDKTFMIGMPLKNHYLVVTVRIVDDQLNLVRIRYRKSGEKDSFVFENGRLKTLLEDCDSGGNPYAAKLINNITYMVHTVYDALHLIYVFNQEQKFLMVELRNQISDAFPENNAFGSVVLSMMDLPDDDGTTAKRVSPHWVSGHHKTLRNIRFVNHDKFQIEGGIFVPDYYVGRKEAIVNGKIYTVIDKSDKLTSIAV